MTVFVRKPASCAYVAPRWYERLAEAVLLWIEDGAYDIRQWLYDRRAAASRRASR